jgi:hypothetical protein
MHIMSLGASRYRYAVIIASVVFRIQAASNPLTILYISLARTNLITHLHFTNYQWIILPINVNDFLCSLNLLLLYTIINPIYKVRSLLLANNPSINTNSFAIKSLSD